MLAQVCPPGSGGVRDFADCLHDAWAARGIASALVEGRAASAGETSLADRLHALAAARDGRLSVVLHFSGYGYAARGLCGWLVDELQSLKARPDVGMRLVVVFHELFASGTPPWRSAFWLLPWQAQVARRLARLADSLWTNTGRHADWLRETADAAVPLQARPVFSNVGELAHLPDWQAREPRAIVFGSAATRARAFRGLRAHAPALARLGVREIVEAGGGPSQANGAAPAGIASRHLGRLPAGELGPLLAQSRFGLLDYPAHCLGKSGVFAAYAAHGCVVIDSDSDSDAGGLAGVGPRAGTHYLDLRAPLEPDADALAGIALRLHRWYGAHSLALQAHELLQAATAARELPAARVAAMR